MERPYTGRAKINESIKGFSIEIPTKRNWLEIIFLTFWLVGWLISELIALAVITGIFGDIIDIGGIYILSIWLIGWTIGGVLTIRNWLWLLVGREILSFEQKDLIITKKGAPLYSPKIYDLREVRNFSLNQGLNSNNIFGMNRNAWKRGKNGIFKFDYGRKTIKTTNELDEAEGRYILNIISKKNYLKN
jgi:hypothetical protein